MAQRAAGSLLRRSLGLAPATSQRALSTSAAPAVAAPAAEGEAAAKAKRAKKKNLFDVVQFLPDWGVGYKVAKTTWRDVSYQITKINLYKDGRHGKAWGIRHKAARLFQTWIRTGIGSLPTIAERITPAPHLLSQHRVLIQAHVEEIQVLECSERTPKSSNQLSFDRESEQSHEQTPCPSPSAPCPWKRRS